MANIEMRELKDDELDTIAGGTLLEAVESLGAAIAPMASQSARSCASGVHYK